MIINGLSIEIISLDNKIVCLLSAIFCCCFFFLLSNDTGYSGIPFLMIQNWRTFYILIYNGQHSVLIHNYHIDIMPFIFVEI